jgi:phage-related minor tail protein
VAISLAVKIWGDSTPLLTELEKVKKQLNQVSKELTKMGQELTMALTLPIVAFGSRSCEELW